MVSNFVYRSVLIVGADNIRPYISVYVIGTINLN